MGTTEINDLAENEWTPSEEDAVALRLDRQERERTLQARAMKRLEIEFELKGPSEDKAKARAYISTPRTHELDHLVPFPSLSQGSGSAGRLPHIATVGPGAFARGLSISWPRLLQQLSLGLALFAALLTAGGGLSRPLGITAGFIALAMLAFGNYAAWRKGLPNWIVGPVVAVIAMWGCLIIAAAVALNGITGH